MDDRSDDESPYSISDDEDDAHELLEIKPPQAKISKRFHSRYSDKHTSSSRQVYVSSRQHHKSDHSRHKEKPQRYVKDRSESSRAAYAKEYEDRLKEPDEYHHRKLHYHSHRGEKVKDERYKTYYEGEDDDDYKISERSKEQDLREKIERRRNHHHKEYPRKEKSVKERSRHERLELETKERRTTEDKRRHHREERKRVRTPERPRYASPTHEKTSIKSNRELNSHLSDKKTVIDIETSPPVLREEYSEPIEVKELEEGEVEEKENSAAASSGSSGSSSNSSSSNSNSSRSSGSSGSSSSSSTGNSESSSENGEEEEKHEEIADEKEDEGEVEEKENSEAKANQQADVGLDIPRVSPTSEIELEKDTLPSYFPAIQGCRSVEEFQCLNRIAEGTYGVVYRAREKRTDKIVALKRLKMEKEKEGFPITSLREINTLLKAQHPNIVTVREIVVGSNMDKIFIVMDYVEHDLKSLMETMKQKKAEFKSCEVKCLMVQLLRAVNHLHDNWILHRDLKTSNLLFSHSGVLKVGDFGLAREYGSPLKHYTQVVVTLWYRAPELLLGAKEYSTSIDIWSVGCIFAEILRMEPLFPGKDEIDQLKLVFKVLGTPTEKVWPEYPKLPVVQNATIPMFPVAGIRSKFKSNILSDIGYDLISSLLMYNTKKRITADAALQHEYFREHPLPIDPHLFRTWSAKSESNNRKGTTSPKPPSGGQNYKDLKEDDGFYIGVGERNNPPGFSLKSTFCLKF